MGMAKTFRIETYGCQMNVYDSAKMAALLKQVGFVEAGSAEAADVMVINSCAVRGHAEERVLGRVAELKGMKKDRPGMVLVLAGCVAQDMGRELLERFPHLDIVVGTESYDCLPEILVDAGRDGRQVCQLNVCKTDPGRGTLPEYPGQATAMVAVMRGCDNFCSYCIVPFVRGRERSRPPDEVINEIEGLAGRGVREVTLVGQNVNSYSYAGTGFPGLLRQAAGIEGIERVRFITSHPKDLGPELLEAMAQEPKACEHLHLPMQSGSDRILGLMNRRYTIGQFLEIVGKARAAVEDLVLTTDAIAGFPGESEDEFRQTLQAMEEIRFDAAFTYKYSARRGTAAERLPGQLPDEVRQERLSSLIALQREITAASNRRDIGRSFEVLVEKPSKQGRGQWLGRTRGNKPVAFKPAGGAGAGHIITVRIDSATTGTLIGTEL